MSAGGGPIGRRQVAVRCFAAEFDDADLEYSAGDDERAPNFVVTPAGARINRLFVVGVLTEVESVSDDVLRGRVVDPTGAFVVYAGQYQPDARAALDRTEPPAFVAVTGKARTFRPDDGDRVYTSLRPESVNPVDADTRDRWTVQAAEQTVARVATFAAALEREERGEELTRALVALGVEPGLAEGIPRAIGHYGTTEAYLAAVRRLALQAAEVVAGERDEVEPLAVAPDEGGSVEADIAGDVEIAAVPVAEAEAGAEVEAETGAEAEADRASVEEGGATEATGDVEAEVGADDAGPTDGVQAGTVTDDDAPGAAADAEGGATATDEAGSGELYEMDDEERAAVEEEFGAEFETGNEVDEPGEADIETPGPVGVEDDAGAGVEASTAGGGEATVEGDAADGGEAAAGEGEAAADSDETAEAGPDQAVVDAAGEATGSDADGDEAADLVDAAVAAMESLDEGEGADHDAVVESVADDREVDAAAVEEAIREALMDGRCYEPDDGRLKAI